MTSQPPASEPQEIAGLSIPCSRGECHRAGMVQCGYIDSQRHRCPTVWCHQHILYLGDELLCTRHASTVKALGSRRVQPGALPAVEHRGASLIAWIHDQTADRVMRTLAAINEPADNVVADAVVSSAQDATGRTYWQKGWRVVSLRGIRFRAVLLVGVEDDATVHLQIGDRVVASGVPPWITNRATVATPGAAGAADDFYARLLQLIADFATAAAAA